MVHREQYTILNMSLEKKSRQEIKASKEGIVKQSNKQMG